MAETRTFRVRSMEELAANLDKRSRDFEGFVIRSMSYDREGVRIGRCV